MFNRDKLRKDDRATVIHDKPDNPGSVFLAVAPSDDKWKMFYRVHGVGREQKTLDVDNEQDAVTAAKYHIV